MGYYDEMLVNQTLIILGYISYQSKSHTSLYSYIASPIHRPSEPNGTVHWHLGETRGSSAEIAFAEHARATCCPRRVPSRSRADRSCIATTMVSRAEKALQLKNEGNELFEKKQYAKAYEKYTAAIDEDENNAVLYSNRAACSLATKKYGTRFVGDDLLSSFVWSSDT